MHFRIILKLFKKIQMLRYCFFLQSSRYVSNEQSCLKTPGLYDDLLFLSNLFHFFYFIFNDPILFHLCSLISPSFFFLMFFLKPLSIIVEKLLYTLMLICTIYVLENLWGFAKIKNYDSLILLLWLSMNKMLDFWLKNRYATRKVYCIV